MQHFVKLMSEWLDDIREIMPWDLEERIAQNPDIVIVDVREPDEFAEMRIPGSINAPRGILESCCAWDFQETIPQLVEARDKEVVVVCRSGYRSLLSAKSMEILGYSNVVSLKTGLRGWNDYEQPLENDTHALLDPEMADDFFVEKVWDHQLNPERRSAPE